MCACKYACESSWDKTITKKQTKKVTITLATYHTEKYLRYQPKYKRGNNKIFIRKHKRMSSWPYGSQNFLIKT